MNGTPIGDLSAEVARGLREVVVTRWFSQQLCWSTDGQSLAGP